MVYEKNLNPFVAEDAPTEDTPETPETPETPVSEDTPETPETPETPVSEDTPEEETPATEEGEKKDEGETTEE